MIPFVDLKSQYRSIKNEIDAGILKVLESSQFALGNEVFRFEKEFAEYCRVKEAVAVNSGTSALHLALLAVGIGPGDEVITVPNTFVATAAAIFYTGAQPVLVDVDNETYNMDPTKIESTITERTKAIMPVHLYGQCAEMDPIIKIAKENDLLVIEDAAQAHGAEYKGRRAGSMGDIAGFSFYPGKNLGAYGEGGAVVTDNPEYAEKVRILRDWGQPKKGHHDYLAFNYRMDGIQGAVLRVKLKYIEQWTEARRANAKLYNTALAGSGIPTPVVLEHNRHVYHVYAVRVKDRDNVRAKMWDKGIATGVHYPIPVHLQKGYPGLGKEGDFPVAEGLAREELSLPMFAELTEEQIAQVVETLTACL